MKTCSLLSMALHSIFWGPGLVLFSMSLLLPIKSNPSEKEDSAHHSQGVKRRGNLPDIDLATLTPQQGFTISGIPIGGSGGLVGKALPMNDANAGDINGDGIDDVIIGISSANPSGKSSAGASYVIYGKQGGYSTPIDLANLSSTDGFAIYGAVANDQSGASVSGAGDINNDGIDDVIIGAPAADPGGKIDAGISYVIYGKQGGYGTAIDLANLSSAQGFAIYGAVASDYLGWSVSSAGDINNDGINDVIMGALYASPNGTFVAGASYVIYGGKEGGYSVPIDLASLFLTEGFAIYGAAADHQLGRSVSNAGDIDGDGIDDVIIGAWNAAVTGASYVIYGKQGGYSAFINLAGLSATDGFAILGAAIGDCFGFSVSGAGDFNGDGIDDVIIGAPCADRSSKVDAGLTYVIYGKQGGYSVPLELATLSSTDGFAILGALALDNLGWSVSNIHDVNGDGIDDVIIGALYADPNSKNNAGSTYIVYGKQGGYGSALINLSSTNGFAINGAAVGDVSGISVSNAGDFNGDGANDMLIASIGNAPLDGSQTSYLIYGPVVLASSSSSPSNSSTTSSSQIDTESDITSNASTNKASWHLLAKWLTHVNFSSN